MKKRKIIIILAVMVAILIPFSAFAAGSNNQTIKSVMGFFGIDTSKLTDQQKADISSYNQKLADLMKEFVSKMVSDGIMTQDQGNSLTTMIDNMLKNANANNHPLFLGIGKKGFDKDDFGFKIDTSKLTDQQKANIKAIYKKMANTTKDYIDKLVSEGLLTSDQAKTIKSRIDSMLNDNQNNVLGKNFMMGGLFKFPMGQITPSKITDQQKTEFINYSKQMMEFQKELIDKYVEYGLITKDQGDALKTKIDNMKKNIEQNGFIKGFHIKKGKLEKYTPQENNNINYPGMN